MNFTGFSHMDYGVDYQKERHKAFDISKEEVNRLFFVMASYFSNDCEEVFVTDIGTWEMTLTNDACDTYVYHGSLCVFFEYKGVELSDLVRDTLEMDELFVFDGK